MINQPTPEHWLVIARASIDYCPGIDKPGPEHRLATTRALIGYQLNTGYPMLENRLAVTQMFADSRQNIGLSTQAGTVLRDRLNANWHGQMDDE